MTPSTTARKARAPRPAPIEPADYTRRTYLATINRTTEELIATVTANFPEELRALPQWVTYTLPWDGKKWTKRPWSPRGFGASSTNPAHWGTFKAAALGLKRQRNVKRVEDTPQGLGFVFTQEARIIGTDLDHCIAEDGTIDPDALDIIQALNSYTEVSPSGDGVHIFARTKTRLMTKGIKRGNIEVYPAGRFFTVTGRHLAGTPTEINDATEWFEAYWAEHASESEASAEIAESVRQALSHAQPKLTPEERVADNMLLNKIRSIKGKKFIDLYDCKGGWMPYYASQNSADLALADCLGYWTDYDAARMDRLFRRSKLMRKKWDDRRGTSTYGANTIAKVINDATDKILFGETR